MVNQLYNWTRFWIPRGESFRLDGGFLSEPQSKIGRMLNPNPVTLESVEPNISCLVLLGEPGIGKSKEIEKQKDLSKARVDEQGDAVLPFDLGVYSTDYNLCHDIFESPTLEAWLRGTHKLYLFLDSLDEGLIAASSLTRLLAQKLNDLPRDRLRFRIACRTAEWQSGFEGDLRRLFGNDSVKVFELLPLCRIDAESAAEQNGIDPARFMAEVARNDVESFASKPVTLNFLLKLFKKNNEFPSTQTELYLEGCKALCDDPERRKDSRRTGKLSIEQRLILAARIAAITVFGNRSGIWIGRDPGDAEAEDVTLRDLCGETEGRDGETFPANEVAIREVLEFTGLFSSGGQDRLRWRHQTYAEFLAALYLERRNFTLSQKLDLILHHGDPERKLVPQLHETAAWLAGMDKVVLQEIVKSEPDVLLRSDVARADTKDRERLVAALLNLYHEEERQPAWFFLDTLKKLSHPSLPDQLRPYIANSSKWIAARQLAIHIAHACKTRGLQDVLADLALDEAAPLTLRCDAAHAVGDIGDYGTKQRLRPLIADTPTDPDKQLKGYASQALWPTCLTSEELFNSITSGTPGFGGSYERFIFELPERLRATDVSTALQWLRKRPRRSSSSGGINKLKDAIMVLAWNNLDLPGTVDLFARVALLRLMSHEPIIEGRSTWDDFTGKPPAPPFSQLVSEDCLKRRAVLGAMITLLSEYVSSEEKRGHFWAFSFNNPFLVGDDLTWFIERFEGATSDDVRQILSQLILWVLRWDDVDHVDTLYAAVQRSALVANRFGRCFAAIALDSAEAIELRARHKHDLEMQEDRMIERPLLKPPPAERVAELLDQFEDDKYEAWWQLNYFMQFLPDGSSETSDYHADLRALPGWLSADELTRARIVRASTKYLVHGDPDTDRWMKTDEIHRPALGGYKALYLLYCENPESIENLLPAVWRKWAPVILAFPATGRKENYDVQLKLIATAYAHAPNEITSMMIVMIDSASKEYGVSHVIEKIEGCWDCQIANAIRGILADKTLKPTAFAYLLDRLLAHDDEEARELSESYVRLSPTPTDEELSRAVAAGRALLLHTQDGAWSVVWSAIQRNNDFGKELFEAVVSAGEQRQKTIAPDLTESELAELYTWLVRNYPLSEDRDVQRGYGAYDVTPRHLIGRWRDSILSRLENFGTYIACEQIRRIAREFSELDWLKWVLHSAQANTRRNTWEAPKPREILQMTRDSNSGLVQSGEQLLRAINESLKQLEIKLQSGTAAAWELWDEKPICKPKREERLAQKVEAHLNETLTSRGIVANREVVVRRGRTDIHVDAVRKSPDGEVYDRVTVIIEVKGCWHRQLQTAMNTQLVARYLAENRCDYGLYLVGWFICDQWALDYRKRQSPKWNLQEARLYFQDQAEQCSREGKLIKAFVLNASL